MIVKINGKYHQNVQLEEHYVVVGEPGGFYLSHVTPTDGTGLSIAKSVLHAIAGTELEGKLAPIGSDGTAAMT